MAGKVRESSFSLKVDLLKKGHEFSFFQVIRLLRLLSHYSEEPENQEVYENKNIRNIRVRPDLSLAFPASDIAKIEEVSGEENSFLVTTTFLGLYGSSSPLPIFYTEDLMDEAAEDSSVSRDFVDIINHRLFFLLFRCWAKYRQFIQVYEENNPGYLEKLFSLIGLGEKELREDTFESHSLLRYTGLFTHFPRSAAGLETLLRDALRGISVEVLPCIKRSVIIPRDQRLCLGVSGNSLGEDSFLGEEIIDRMGKFRLKIGPLVCEQFNSLLRGNPDHRRLAFLTRFFLGDSLEYDIELTLREGEAEPIHLGVSKWSRLGMDTWLFSSDRLGEVKTTFPPEYQ
jgi:type VI secretion system protein ImpH